MIIQGSDAQLRCSSTYAQHVRKNAWKALLTASLLVCASGVQATESGTSVYLLGSRGPMAALLPDHGFYLQDDVYFYSGSLGGERRLPTGGKIVADVDSDAIINLLTGLYVLEGEVMGGKMAVAGIVPAGHVAVDASVELNPGNFQPLTYNADDSATVLGDPLINATLGWQSGKLFWTASMLVNMPIGNYRENEIANLSFNRWAADVSGAVTWFDPDSGTEASLVAGMTFNGENDETHYDTGNEAHLEWSVSTSVTQALSLGVVGYHHRQVTADSGSGARLGDFKGRVNAIGLTMGYNLMVGKQPISTRLKIFEEFDAKNRMEGTAGFLTITLPL